LREQTRLTHSDNEAVLSEPQAGDEWQELCPRCMHPTRRTWHLSTASD